MKRTFENTVWISLGLVVASLLLIPAVTYNNIRQLNKVSELVAHSYDVHNLAGNVLSVLVNAETGVRGFIISGNDEFLQFYNDALSQLDGLIVKLKEMTKVNSHQQARITKLEAMTAVRLGQFKEAIALRRNVSAATLVFAQLRTGEEQMDAIRKNIAEIERVEDDLLKDRKSKSAKAYQVVISNGIVTAFLGLTMVGAFIWLLNRSLRIHKRAQVALDAAFKESADLKASIDEHAIVATTDPQGKITFVNDKFCAISKYSREELLGQDHRIVNSGHHPKAFFRDIWSTIARGRPWHGEIKNKAKDGSYYWVDTTIVPFLNEEGKPRQYVAIRADITERKKAEDALSQSAERLRFMAESMPQKIYAAKPNGDVDYFNLQWTEFTGLSFEQIKDWGWTQFIHPDDLEENVRRWKQSINTGEPFMLEHRFRRKDGVYRWHLTRSHAMRDAEGKILLWIGSNTDIDDIKRTDEDLKQTAEDLRRSNSDLEQFAHVSAHDLQEPLRTISNYVDLLQLRKKDKLDLDEVKYLDHIQVAALHAQELVQALLDYASITAKDYPFEWTDLEVICEKVLLNIKTLIEENGAKITHDPLPKLKVNSLQIARLLQNLISNGIKYRSENKPHVHISAQEENQKWIFSVKDNGIGIDAQYKEQVFMIFKRLHSKTLYPGTGIGLAVCKKIVQQHGGEIWIESEPQKGSTFYFSLPVIVGGGRK